MRALSESDWVVAAARIRYHDDQPYSLDHQDIYHARDGAAETARVFVTPCRLDERARELAGRPGPEGTVRVGELGFGSGLNFVIAAERCLAAGARLHFMSCEARPIDASDFAAIARHRSSAHPLYNELAAVYPPRVGGWHQRILAGGRVSLSLWLGDARGALADLAGRQRRPFHAWFLDGFAPDRNPELWEADLFEALSGLSASGTRVATFTAAGRVRRALTDAGFSMERVDQRPHKRESLAGTFIGRGTAPPRGPQRVAVVGGGLAGASAAWHLACAGCAVTLFDARATTAGTDDPPGSTMAATVLHGRLLADGSPAAALRCHGFLYASALHRHALALEAPAFRPTGALQVAASAAEARLRAIATRYLPSGPWLRWVERDEAASMAGWPLPEGALHLPDAGIVDIPAAVGVLGTRPGIELVREPVDRLPDDVPVVLACGTATRRFAPAGYLELAAVQGQLDFVKMERLPRLPLVGDRYLVPGAEALLAAGSTYEHRPWDPEEATRANLRQLDGRACEWRYRQRGTRNVSSDRTAIAGPLFDPAGNPVPNLYVSAGHGSAGNVSAHLAAAVLTAHIAGDCPPLAREVEALLSSLRFRERQARRGVRHVSGKGSR